ncbi:Fatty acyl-CoA reductase 1, partial [Stegodyphus mimosarum]
MVALGLGIGKGFVRVMRCDPEKLIHLVPVDIVANCHVVAAWNVATRRTASPFVVNCTTSDEIAPCTWGHYAKVLLDMSLKHPLPKSYQSPCLSVQKSSVGYWL